MALDERPVQTYEISKLRRDRLQLFEQFSSPIDRAVPLRSQRPSNKKFNGDLSKRNDNPGKETVVPRKEDGVCEADRLKVERHALFQSRRRYIELKFTGTQPPASGDKKLKDGIRQGEAQRSLKKSRTLSRLWSAMKLKKQLGAATENVQVAALRTEQEEGNQRQKESRQPTKQRLGAATENVKVTALKTEEEKESNVTQRQKESQQSTKQLERFWNGHKLEKIKLPEHNQRAMGLRLREKDDKESREVRGDHSSRPHRMTDHSLSYKPRPKDVDPKRIQITNTHMKPVLQSKEENIEELNVQVKCFQDIASQHHLLQTNNKSQSLKMLELQRDLKRVQEERDNLDEEEHGLEGEVDGQRSDQLSHVPSSLKSFTAKVSHADLEAKNEDLSAQVNELKSHCDNLQSQLDTVTPQGVGVFLEGDPGENEALIKHLEQQLVLVQKENRKLQDDVKDLEQKLDDVKIERDDLSKQNLKLFAVKNTYKEKPLEMENLKSQVAVTREIVISLANQTAAKVTEVSDHKEEKEVLQKELDDLRGELEARRLQADYYEEDLKKESQDRENMAGRIDDEKAQQKLKLQMFVENSESTNEQLDRVREINTTLEVEKANLEADLTEQEKKISELEKSIRGYTKQLTCHEQLLNKLEEERQSKEQLEKELVKCLEQTDLATVEKMILQNQLNVVEINYKLKVKQFEIMAAEKNNMEDQIGRMNARYSASQLELTDCRKQLETTIADISRLSDERRKLDDEVGKTTARYNALQLDFTDCREQLETNNSRLSDEILAKTQQVRHYKKQTDSYKATLDETADGLENTERELQKKVEDLETIKIRADQIQQRLDHELKKTLAQVPKRVRSNLRINLEALAVRPNRPIRFDKPIGKGSYGSVYQIEFNGQRCIAKRLHDILIGRLPIVEVSMREKNGIHENFVQECVLLSQMKHENITRFMGVVVDRRDNYNLTLLMEQLSTDLHEYLLNMQTMIPLSTKVSILHDTSCGLLHLHQQSIIHRDLSAANVLLQIANERPVQAKIADLGMSKFVDCNDPLTEAPGALAYMSPESLLGQHYNDSLDIFSFGVICLFAAVQEFPEVSHEHVPDAVYERGEGELFKRKQWIDRMEAKQPELSPLVLWCLQYDATKRPSTFCLNIILEEMRKDYQQTR